MALEPDLFAAARAAWPDVALDDAELDAFLDERAAATGDATPRAELDLPALFLGCACVRGEPHALAAFERVYLAAVPTYVARITTDAAIVDEVKQQLRIKLFVAEPGGVPKIAHYGRGALGAWLRVIACRQAIDLLRARDRPMAPLDEESLADRAIGDDPRLAGLKAAYRSHVQTAFAAALAALPPDDRAMLRLCFVDGLALGEIGRIYQLSKSAVSRRLARCREALLGEAKRRLAAQLGIAAAELDSIMRLVTSQLHLSLPRLLRD